MGKELRVPRRIIERSNAIEVQALTNALCCLHVGVKTTGGNGRITFVGESTNGIGNARGRPDRTMFKNLNTFEEAYIMVLKDICNSKSIFYEGDSVGRQICDEQQDCIEEAIKDTTLDYGRRGRNP